MERVEQKFIKGYTLIEQIGAGGFGAVYRAKQSTVDREVAIKFILPTYANNPDFIRRFESEAYTIARLEHPHITPLIDYWRDPEGAYLVMRYLRGGSVREALQSGPYELLALSQTLDQIASALDFAHRNKVIHRDIKPGNILLDEDGNAYLADFGIAKNLASMNDGMTGADAVIGSLDYISPEQARSEPATNRTDIYSMGVMIYEMITGEHPFKDSSTIERLYKHINDPLPDILGLPEDVGYQVNEIIQKATAKDPANRYSDVLTMATLFREAIGREKQNEESIVEHLTMREQEILSMIAKGMSNNEIAHDLVVTLGTVKWHIRQVYSKLGVRSRVQAIVRARALNLIVTGDTISDGLSEMTNFATVISLPEPENPYKGLHAFQTADSRDFFGREELTRKLIDNMQTNAPDNRFLAVIGPSGSGKSSLVKAGLIPALWKGEIPGSEKWFVVDMIPGTHPLDKLETALIRVATNQASALREQLQRDERGLLRVADIILPGDDTELVIVIDQFEEIFTLVDDERIRQHFLDLLLTVSLSPRSRVRVIITLRADYYDRPLLYPEFGEMLRNRMETILPLSAHGLERAIRGPAERVGVAFEQGLVEQIVSEMNYQSGALPLLQYALTELFDRRQGRILTNESYREIGGAVGALANRADEIYAALTDESKALAHQMFMRLVSLGEGAEDTRRRATHAELLSLTENTDLMEEIIDQFAAYRLLSLDHDAETRQPTVDVAHEAILREWEQLRNWINESRAELRLQRQLSRLMQDWQKADQEASYLVRGARLEQFEGWSQTTSITLTPIEKQFLQASLDARAKQHAEERAQQAREAVLEKRSQQRMRYLSGALAVLLFGAIIFSIFALDREQRTRDALSLAEREATVNRSLVLSDDALKIFELGETDASLLIALEAVNMDDPPQDSIRALAEVARGIGTRAVLEGHTNSVKEIAVSQDNQLMASGSCATLEDDTCLQGEIILWSLQTDTEMMRWDEAQSGWITGLAFSPDGNSLLSSAEDGSVYLWSALDGTRMAEFVGHDGAVNAVSFHPTEQQFLTAGADGLIILWNAVSGEEIRRFEGHSSAVNAIVFNAEGTLALSGSDDSQAILWDVATGDIVQTYEQDEEDSIGIENVSFDRANAQIIATNTRNNIWNQETGDIVRVNGPSLRIQGLDVGPNGTIYQGLGRFVRFVNPSLDNTNANDRLIYDHHALVTVVRISQDGSQLISGAEDGVVRVWNINAQLARRIPVPAGASRLRLSPDQNSLVVGAFGANSAFIYDLADGSMVHQLENTYPISWVVEFSPDGRYVAIGYINFYQNDVDTAITLWDAESGELIREFVGQNIRISDLSFSSDGRYILSGSQSFAEEGSLYLWDVATGDLISEFSVEGGIANVMITDDGQYAMVSSYFGQFIGVWDIATGTMLRQRDFDTHVEFSRLGATDQTALVGLDDGRLLEVDMETLETLRSFDGHTASIWDIALSRDGQLMVSGQDRGLAIVWDYTSGRELDRLPQPGGLTNVTFGPDDRTIFTSSYVGNVAEWYVADQSLQDLRNWVESNRYIRDFTCIEREMYQITPYCDA